MKVRIIRITSLAAIIYSIVFVSAVIDKADEQDRKFLQKPSKFDRLYHSAQTEYMKTRDPKTKEIPADIRNAELAFAARIPKKEDLYKSRSAAIQTQQWQSRGPWNVAGRMKDIEFDANDESGNTLLAASASGGVWRTEDFGESWVNLSPDNSIQALGCLEQDKRPDKTNIWYYGTGELLSTTDRNVSNMARTVGYGDGIYKSTDNGASWFPLESTTGKRMGILYDHFQGVWDIKVDNSADKDIVYAACLGGIMRSEDGGESWGLALGDSENKNFCSDIEIAPSGKLFAALSILTNTGEKADFSGIFTSEDGENWKDISPENFPSSKFDGCRTIKIDVAPGNENVLYVLCEAPSEDTPVFIYAYHSLWKATYDPGSDNYEWEELTDNLPGGWANTQASNGYNTLGGYAMTIDIHPSDENIVFLSGTSLYRSDNGFADTNQISLIGGYPYRFTPEELHPDLHALCFHPDDPGQIFIANDGGIQYTNEPLAEKPDWLNMNNALLTTQFYSVAMDHSNTDDFIIGGLQDNAVYSTFSDDPALPWEYHIGGDGFVTAVANDKEFVVATIYWGRVYTITFDQNNIGEAPIFQTGNPLGSELFNFYTIFALEPVENEKLYLPAYNVIWRKDNIKAAAFDRELRNKGWHKLDNTQTDGDESITAIAASKEPANRIYYGTDNGRVYRLDDAHSGNPAPVEITGNEFPEGAFASCISIDERDADRFFVVFSNYNVQSIFHTSDGGITWRAEGGNLEDEPDGAGAGPSIRWIETLNIGDETMYFAATSTGLYSTTELAGTQTLWVQEGANAFGNVLCAMVDARSADGKILVATHGRGIYSCEAQYPGGIAAAHSLVKHITCRPNPASGKVKIAFALEKAAPLSVNLHDSFGNIVANLANSYFKAGENTIAFDASGLAAGVYFINLDDGAAGANEKIIISR